MSVLVSQLVADTRVMSGLRSNQLFTDVQIVSLLSDGGAELYDMLVDAFQHYFVSKFDFTLAAGTAGSNIVALPADFEKDNSLERNPLLSNPEVIGPLASWLERNQCSAVVSGGGRRRYFITGDFLEVFPLGGSAGDYRLYYTPQFARLDASTTVRLATTAALPGFVAAGVGPGHTLTGGITTPLIIDGSAVVTAEPVLLKDEPTPSNNGVYTVTAPGVAGVSVPQLTRATYYDTNAEITAAPPVGVTAGTVNAGLKFMITSSPVNVDVLPLTYGAQALLPSLAPWALYLKAHAAIAIRTSRGQATDQLEGKLGALKQRIARAIKNRTEAPKQAPMIRRGSAWVGGGGDGGGNW